MSTYRFSVSWPRVMDSDGAVIAKGMDFYSRLVDELLANDVAPWLTLYHWDLPAGAAGRLEEPRHRQAVRRLRRGCAPAPR